MSFDLYSILVLDPLIISIACPPSSSLCTYFYISSVHKLIFFAILFLCRTTNSISPSSSSKPFEILHHTRQYFPFWMFLKKFVYKSGWKFCCASPSNLMFPSPVLHCSQYFVTYHCRVEQRWCHSGCCSWRACAWRSHSTWLVLRSQIHPQTQLKSKVGERSTFRFHL